MQHFINNVHNDCDKSIKFNGQIKIQVTRHGNGHKSRDASLSKCVLTL